MSIIARAAVLGAITGGRSFTGLAALALSSTKSSGGSWLTNPWTARVAGTLAAAEYVGDKLPNTPSRLQPQGFAPRLALGALAGGILAHRAGESNRTTGLAAVVGLAGAAAGSWLGATGRAKASAALGQDIYGALAEDALVLAGARYAVS